MQIERGGHLHEPRPYDDVVPRLEGSRRQLQGQREDDQDRRRTQHRLRHIGAARDLPRSKKTIFGRGECNTDKTYVGGGGSQTLCSKVRIPKFPYVLYCVPPPEAQNWTFARPRMGHAFCLFSQLILLVVLGGEVGELERRGDGRPSYWAVIFNVTAPGAAVAAVSCATFAGRIVFGYKTKYIY